MGQPVLGRAFESKTGNKRMKILYIAHMTPMTGATLALVNLIKGIKKISGGDVEMAVLSPMLHGDLIDELACLGIPVYAPPVWYAMNWYPQRKNIICNIRFFLEERVRNVIGRVYCHKVIRRYRPDIVHCNTGACDIALNYCVKHHIPHVWHIREYQDLDFNLKVYPSMTALKRKMHLPGNYNIAITKGVFNHFNLREIDKVIYDGVIASVEENKTDIEFDFPYLLFVGSYTKAKGLADLLRAFVEFHKKKPEVHLLVAGKIIKGLDYYKECYNIIRTSNLDNYIHLLDFRKDAYNLMQHAIALIVPSQFEGFGFITAEAMYNRCIVIGRDTAGTKEQFDNGFQETGMEIGLRFTNQKELLAKMIAACDVDYAEMKTRARKVVLNNYTLEVCTRSVLSYYHLILNNDGNNNKE